jgi:hypothetical protein
MDSFKVEIKERSCEEWPMDGIVSLSCQMAGFGASGVWTFEFCYNSVDYKYSCPPPPKKWTITRNIFTICKRFTDAPKWELQEKERGREWMETVYVY